MDEGLKPRLEPKKTFWYKAVDAQGKEVQDYIEASDENTAMKEIAKLGLATAEIQELGGVEEPVEKKVKINLPPAPSEAPKITQKLPTLPPEVLAEAKKGPETKTYSADFIKERVKVLLESQDAIKRIVRLETDGKGNEIGIAMEIVAGPMNSNITVQTRLENKIGAIAVKSYDIKAGFMVKMAVESMIKPKLDQVSEILRSYIEDEEKKKVKRMEIVNGKLKVTFGEPETRIPTPSRSTGAEAVSITPRTTRRPPRTNPSRMDAHGKEIKGYLDAADQTEAIKRIKEMDFFPTKIREVSRKDKRNKQQEEAAAAWTEEKKQELAGVEKQIVELEGVAHYISETITSYKGHIENSGEKENSSTNKIYREVIKLLESDPITYLTQRRDDVGKTLKYILGNEDYTEERKHESETRISNEIKEWQRMIDILESLNPKAKE